MGPPGPAEWAALSERLSGRLSLPGGARYPVDRELYDPRFDIVRPAAIAFCASATDVARAVSFGRRHGLDMVARSGGHSYGGYSTTTGLVIDVSLMSAVTATPAAGTATIGAGARLIDVYSALAAQGVSIPAGSCPTVGIAGLSLGGGVGVLARLHGLTLDHITGFQMVTADADVVRADAGTNPDLYWACRGGGGGNFGVVTSIDYATFPTTELALFGSSWPWAAADQLLPAWLEWISGAPDELWSNCIIEAAPGAPEPTIYLGGVMAAGQSELASRFAALARSAGQSSLSPVIGQNSFSDAMYIEAGCQGLSQAACHLAGKSPGGTLGRKVSIAKSDILNGPLGDAGVDALLAGIAERHQQGGPGSVSIDSWGGAINRVAPEATAFVHRQALACAQYQVAWGPAATNAELQAGREWMGAWYSSLRPYMSGQAYQNYIDPGLADWAHAYYGANLGRLRQVKARWDPANIWHFAQSIPLP